MSTSLILNKAFFSETYNMVNLLPVLRRMCCLPNWMFKRRRNPDETSSSIPNSASSLVRNLISLHPDQISDGSQQFLEYAETSDPEAVTDEQIPTEMDVKELDDALDAAMVTSPGNTDPFRSYIPTQAFDDLVTEDAIQQSIRAIPRNESLKKYILHHARKVFSTLVVMGSSSVNRDARIIRKCEQSKFCDTDLPILCDRDGKTSYQSFRGGNNVDFPAAAEFFKDWSRAEVGRFCDAQWRFLAPVIDRNTFTYVLHEKCSLPYLKIVGDKKDSYFSTVTKVLMHQEHVSSKLYPDIPTHEVAIKELKSVKDTDGRPQQDVDNQRLQDEKNTLQLIRDLPNVCMIKAIAAIKQGTKYCFLFPWTEVGNLRDLWRDFSLNNEGHFLNRQTLRWSLGEMKHIACAIEKLHETGKPRGQYGRHGDLKPENILVFKDSSNSTPPKNFKKFSLGRLYVADMGLVRFHSVLTPDRTAKTNTMAGTDKYIAPEVNTVNENNKPRSRSYDFWSMGCIYLEFITWLLCGYKELEIFNQKVTSFFSLEGGLEVHGSVRDQINYIRTKEPRCANGTVLRQLLDLIDKKLFKFNHNTRISAREMHQELTALYENAEQGEHSYLSAQLSIKAWSAAGSTAYWNARSLACS
ncbi:kinase-like domain-containing protein [Daldinia grandis]|nr:kinase-like domain-containing protein [Daldinia grandis]